MLLYCFPSFTNSLSLCLSFFIPPSIPVLSCLIPPPLLAGDGPGQEDKVTVSGEKRRLTFNFPLVALRSQNTKRMQEQKWPICLCILCYICIVGVSVSLEPRSSQKHTCSTVCSHIKCMCARVFVCVAVECG